MPATQTAQLSSPIRIDLPEHDRRRLLELLNGRLTGKADLYSEGKQAHRNEVFPFIDLIAEWKSRGKRGSLCFLV